MKYKVALVHDYLTQRGGGERVLLAMAEAFPEAPIFTSAYFPGETFGDFKKKDIRTTYLQGAYSIFRNYRLLLPFYPAAFRRISLKGFDIILSSASAFAKCVTKPKGAMHICYCYNPTRFLWMRGAYLSEEKYSHLKGLYLGLFFEKLKNADLKAAQDVDSFISISFTVKERIKKIYGRDSDVIYCPVECGRFSVSRVDDGYFLIVSRLMGHKRIDVAVRAFNALGLKLKIVGSGPQYRVLKKMAHKNIEFVGSVEREEVAKLYSRCRALVYPQEEDFGIAPLEANATGKPVIAFAKGGILETMNHSTALFFHNQTPEDLAEAVKKIDYFKFNPEKLRENSLLFDKAVFISKLRAKVNDLYEVSHAKTRL